MFIGTNNLILDGKHRMSMPTKYRDRLNSHAGGKCVVAPAVPLIVPNKKPVPVDCLWLYPAIEWEAVIAQVLVLPSTNPVGRMLQQQFMGNAEEVYLDAGGRLLIPARLREYANIVKNVALVGQGKKFELWDQEKWSAQQGWTFDDESNTEQIAAQLNALTF